jgi:hypothetical protein
MALLRTLRLWKSGRPRAYLRLTWLAGVALLCWLGSLAPAHGQISREYQIKAVFLFNFTQFVEWPPDAFRDNATPLVIGVLGEDPFGAFLDETVRGETAQGRRLVVERYADIHKIGTCHVLFISRSEAERVRAILDRVKHRRTLTVSDIEGFASEGGVIAFVPVAGKLRLRVNLDVAHAAGLTLSSRLLRPAQIVRSRRE